jgi:hypothetical protein
MRACPALARQAESSVNRYVLAGVGEHTTPTDLAGPPWGSFFFCGIMDRDNAEGRLADAVRRGLERRSRRSISGEDVREAVANLTGYLAVLCSWLKQDHHADVAAGDQLRETQTPKPRKDNPRDHYCRNLDSSLR